MERPQERWYFVGRNLTGVEAWQRMMEMKGKEGFQVFSYSKFTGWVTIA
jgi:hypothetical protein